MSSILESLNFLGNSADFIELRNGDRFQIDLRYNGLNNFVGQDIYGPFNRAFLHRVAATKLERASDTLMALEPRYRFIIYDALRPRSIQRILWGHVVGTPAEKYLANPELGSLHNFGFAVDLSVVDEQGRELDMGAGFDDFRPIAQPQLELEFAARGELSPQHLKNRHLLRGCMESAGFAQLPHEWWHYDALPKAEVRANYQLIE